MADASSSFAVRKPRPKAENLPIALVCAVLSSMSALSGKVLTHQDVGMLVQWVGLILGSLIGACIIVWSDPDVFERLRDLFESDHMNWVTYTWLICTCSGADIMWVSILAAQVFLHSAHTVSLSMAISIVFMALLSALFIEDYIDKNNLFYSGSSLLFCTVGAIIMISMNTRGSEIGQSIGFIIAGSFANALRNVGIEYLTVLNPQVFNHRVLLGARFLIGGVLLLVLFAFVVIVLAVFYSDRVSLTNQLNFGHLFSSWLSICLWLVGLAVTFALNAILATLSVLRTNAVWTNVIITSMIPITLLFEMVILNSNENTSNIIGMVCIMVGSLVIPIVPLTRTMIDTFNSYVSYSFIDRSQIPKDEDEVVGEGSAVVDQSEYSVIGGSGDETDTTELINNV